MSVFQSRPTGWWRSPANRSDRRRAIAVDGAAAVGSAAAAVEPAESGPTAGEAAAESSEPAAGSNTDAAEPVAGPTFGGVEEFELQRNNVNKQCILLDWNVNENMN
uniref:(northern house mosquito) hypothetical protein n=1 Tax=Culex pipiens TaxID=7175 RepID=A0A8D8BCB2_CULPI